MSDPHILEDLDLFVYKAITDLDGARLAVVQPASDLSADIHCNLVHTTLKECEHVGAEGYTALSYIWGDTKSLKAIWVDEFKMQVTANLYLALRDLRDKDQTLRLWADALCIDQHNSEEKSLQVPMMGKIYATAKDTIIHIPVDHALQASVQEHISLYEFLPHAIRKFFMPHDIRKAICRSECLRRIWVLKEFVLSKQPWIHCAQKRWKWEDLHAGLFDISGIVDIHNPTIDETRINVGIGLINSMSIARNMHFGGKQYSMMGLVSRRR